MNGLFALTGQPLEERPTGWVSQGFENMVSYDMHSQIITIQLWIVKPFFERHVATPHLC